MKQLTSTPKGLMLLGIMLLTSLLFTSCNHEDEDEDNDIIWDFYPVNAYIYIRNTDGANLLNPETPGNLVGKDIRAEYLGETYEADWNPGRRTRLYMPKFYGLKFIEGFSMVDSQEVPDAENNYLLFGEFDGAQDQNIDLTLTIGDLPQKYRIELTHTVRWKHNAPDVVNIAKLNGEIVPYYDICITLF